MALVVLTGGARSGKSAAATELAAARLAMVQPFGGHVVVVAFGDGSDDPEMAERIDRHRADRPDEFGVLEPIEPVEWLEEPGPEAIVVLDCLGTLLGRIMTAELDDGGRDAVASRFLGFVDDLTRREGDTIVVTNEVGDGIVPAYASGRLFRDLLGSANRRLVSAADASYLTVCGRLVALDGLPRSAAWPAD